MLACVGMGLAQCTVGPEAAAVTLVVDRITSEISMTGLELNSLAFAVRGEGAVLRGEVLTLRGAAVSTCIGLETPPYVLEGLQAKVDLDARSVVLTGGSLRVGRTRLPLQEQVVISEESLATFSLPVRVQNVG